MVIGNTAVTISRYLSEMAAKRVKWRDECKHYGVASLQIRYAPTEANGLVRANLSTAATVLCRLAPGIYFVM